LFFILILKADIWSLGITIIELASGNPPFANEDPRNVIYIILKSNPPKLGPDFSYAIKELVDYCLKEEPEDVC